MGNVLPKFAAALVWFARRCGLVFAVFMALSGGYFLTTRPDELGDSTVLFTVSKLGFFFIWSFAYVYCFFKRGAWHAVLIAVGIIALLTIVFFHQAGRRFV